jgi:hypothetical protein
MVQPCLDFVYIFLRITHDEEAAEHGAAVGGKQRGYYWQKLSFDRWVKNSC